MLKLVGWAQGIFTFRGGSSEMLTGVAFIFRVHLVLGMTIFLIFPFTRLVHVWSAPFEYNHPALSAGEIQKIGPSHAG
ncbi:Respiratory nitrate reductase 2 gamma chain [Leclercia adecarboxylata]|uniref:Respiratory nitrate reductase 2 gamma chain n=1 Tax=Leclercia adecarboxylata TaxID=83655 RepID=A0A4U9HVG5_9ENTR|nr:Respiratory nitrate reductase 2 gamma chain [Leclercia adecarboxylata]